MKTTAFGSLAVLLLATTVTAVSQADQRGGEPILRVDPGGPTSFVTALAFSPDGQTLYAGGWDKVVRAWSRDSNGKFVIAPAASLHVPIGPGSQGNIDALAISPDGQWLAVGGEAHATRVANFREAGWILPSAGKTDDIWLDEGTINLFNRQTGEVRQLRGHRGPVAALAFSSSENDLLLASAAEEWDKASDSFQGKLRLWRVADRSEIDETFVPYEQTRPQLAVLPGARVAVAWNDGNLRIWDTALKRVDAQPDGKFNNSISLLDNAKIVTGSSSGTAIGQLSFWKLAPGKVPPVVADRETALDPLPNGEFAIPRAFALIGQASDHVAVASLVGTPDANRNFKPKRMQLRIVSLQPQAFGATIASTDLWATSDTPRMPVLAATANGEHLAVAGGPSHEIFVYSIGDLLAKKFQPQTLASPALAMNKVAFAKNKDGELALLLREQGSQSGDFDVVFPLASGRPVPFQAAGDWKQADTTSDWKAKLVDGHIEVRHTDGRVGKQVTLPPTEQDAIFAVAPPAPKTPFEVPILALATHERGLPRLSLFNATTGEQVIQYTGHTERISAIAFSPDFRLLASVGEDQTVCVWSLLDVPKVLGKQGQLLGVALDKELKVVNVEPDSKAAERLKAGDRLAGYVTAEGLRPWPGKQSFYEHWRTLKPDSELTVQRTRGDATEDVKLPVGQAIDERKPLFSLLFAKEPGLADWQWVGWNPLGPFESSDRRIERYLGWHFNTGDPARPTAYAELDQYREKYFRKGLLFDLARDGELLAEPVPAPLLRPAMSLLLPLVDNDPLTDEQPIVIRQPRDSVQLALDYAFPASAVQQATLEIDGQPQNVPFRREADGTWRADLPKEFWQPGPHRLRAVLKTQELTPQTFSEELQIRFAPAVAQVAPNVLPAVYIISPAPDQQVTEFNANPKFEVEGRLVLPPNPSPFTLQVNGIVVVPVLAADKRSGTFETLIPLTFGDNPIDVRVQNQGQAAPSVQTINVGYRPAPSIVRIDSPKQVASPFVDLTILGWSETNIKQVVLDERTLAANSYRVDRKEKGFRVVIRNQPFQPDRKSLALRLYAEDSPTPAVTDIPTPELMQKPIPAEIVIIDPARNVTINEPSYTVHFRVSSQSQLRAVEFWQDGKSLFRTENAAELKPPDGSYVKQVPVKLQPGINNFEVIAENDGGLQKEALAINNLGQPVSLTVDGFAPFEAPDQLIKPDTGGIGEVHFPEKAPSARVWLQGKVVWHDPTDARLKNADQQLRVWVNGHQQDPETLDPLVVNGAERRFKIPILLGRQLGNLVEIGLPGMEREASSRFLIDVDCNLPSTKQRLHVLVVGLVVPDTEGLVKRTIEALQGKPTGSKEFKIGERVEGFIYGPIVDPVLSNATINRQLHKINQIVKLLQVKDFANNKESANDIVLVYYQGGMVNNNGQFFLSTRHTNDPNLKQVLQRLENLKLYSISDNTLTHFVENGRGAWVLMLDVDRENPPGDAADAKWPQDSHAAMLRYARLNAKPAIQITRLIDAIKNVKPSGLGELAEGLQPPKNAQPGAAAPSYEHYVPDMLQKLQLRGGK